MSRYLVTQHIKEPGQSFHEAAAMRLTIKDEASLWVYLDVLFSNGATRVEIQKQKWSWDVPTKVNIITGTSNE